MMYRKNRQVRILVYLALPMLLINILTIFPQLDFIVEVKASSESLLGEVEDFALNFACQRKIFYAQGRHWVFYWNSTKIALRTSNDGITFTGEMIIANVDED
ncbi:hypothetical protein KAU92_06715, partial [Candidatus Bathyarchaeota archaeon]|nr:hypothetical protein [Candidatus Bathyarchaeota archaeon]